MKRATSYPGVLYSLDNAYPYKNEAPAPIDHLLLLSKVEFSTSRNSVDFFWECRFIEQTENSIMHTIGNLVRVDPRVDTGKQVSHIIKAIFAW